MMDFSQGRGQFACADRLEVGDRIAPFALPAVDGSLVNPLSDRLAGRPLLLVFECAGGAADSKTVSGKAGSAFEAELSALGAREAVLRRHDALVLVLTRRSRAENAALQRAHSLPFPLLSDPAAKVYAACGLDPLTVGRAAVTLALDGNLRLIGLCDGAAATRWPAIAAALAGTAEPDAALPLAGHPPVLVLPRVLTAADCTALVEVWHRPAPLWHSDGFTTAGYHQEIGDFKISNKNYGRVVQMVVRDPELQRYLDAKLQRRVMPEILKTFSTKVSRREEYRIACYDAAEGGSLGPHRDNPTRQTRHRRFTMTVALNAGEFEGGGLQFREYSRRAYLVPTGTAIVWSCGLLHEVLPVTAGRRFILGTHLFGN